MLKDYFISMPHSTGSLEEEWEQCVNQVIERINEGYRPVKLNVFTNSAGTESFFKDKKMISGSLSRTLGDQIPSVSITIHPPENQWKVSIEGLYQKKGSAEFFTKFYGTVPYVVIISSHGKEIWAAGLGTEAFFDDARKSAVEAFEMVAGILRQEGMTFNNLIRQWNYIGNILELRSGFQNYQVFNEVRSEYYSKFRSIPGFPSATGIGMKLGGVYIDFCAIGENKDLLIKPVNNPNQVNAYEYTQQVLKGLIAKGKPRKNPPQFERALYVANGSSRTLFVSGTASIIGQETIGKGNISEQTLVTIENINKLKDSAYIGQLTGQEISGGKCSLIRVYVREKDDLKEVRNICSNHYAGVPSIYVEADICRDDLLVEIEAEYNY